MGNLPNKTYKGHGFFKRTKKERIKALSMKNKRAKEKTAKRI